MDMMANMGMPMLPPPPGPGGLPPGLPPGIPPEMIMAILSGMPPQGGGMPPGPMGMPGPMSGPPPGMMPPPMPMDPMAMGMGMPGPPPGMMPPMDPMMMGTVPPPPGVEAPQQPSSDASQQLANETEPPPIGPVPRLQGVVSALLKLKGEVDLDTAEAISNSINVLNSGIARMSGYEDQRMVEPLSPSGDSPIEEDSEKEGEEVDYDLDDDANPDEMGKPDSNVDGPPSNEKKSPKKKSLFSRLYEGQ